VIDVTEFADLHDRMTQLEERLPSGDCNRHLRSRAVTPIVRATPVPSTCGARRLHAPRGCNLRHLRAALEDRAHPLQSSNALHSEPAPVCESEWFLALVSMETILSSAPEAANGAARASRKTDKRLSPPSGRGPEFLPLAKARPLPRKRQRKGLFRNRLSIIAEPIQRRLMWQKSSRRICHYLPLFPSSNLYL
jgi:hypothetical protein